MSKSTPEQQLWDICRAFVDQQRIICAEATAEDRVYVSAPDFVHSICEIVGYHGKPKPRPEAPRRSPPAIPVFEDGV